MTRSVPRHLVIPVETLNREFDSKLLVAILACSRGWRPIIGNRTRLHERLHRLPPSVYVSKGVRSGSKPIFRLLKKFGHVAVALDEEGLLRPPEDVYLSMMLDKEAFNFPRLLFAWGESNAETWRKYPDYHGAPIIETGNPRIDLLRPELRAFYAPKAEAIRAEHGAFVLFSSNFSVVNHFIPDQVRFRVARHADKEVADEARDELVAHKRALYQAFHEMLPRLAEAIAPAKLIARPHPSENHETWQDTLGAIPNVRVIHEGPIAPWLLAARALVHSSCTSAVEAAVLGTPAFSFRPVVSERFDQPISNGLSNCYSAPEDIIPAIKKAVEDSVKAELSPDQKRLINHHIAALEGPLSAERILAALEEHRERLETERSARQWLEGFYTISRRNFSRRRRKASRRSRGNRYYIEHKFKGISHADVVEKVAELRAAWPELPEVAVVQKDKEIFELTTTQ